jgi:hypothetical protein
LPAPLVLVATVLHGSRAHGFREWERGLASQRTFLRWDVLLAVPQPPPWIHEWARSRPFGPERPPRLKQPESVAGGQQLVWEKFLAWGSYDRLLVLDPDVELSPTYLQRLYDAQAPGAVGEAPAGDPSGWFSAALLIRELVETFNSFTGAPLSPVVVEGARWRRVPQQRVQEATS